MQHPLRSPAWRALEEAAHAIPLHDHLRVVRLMHEYVVGIRQLAGLPPVVALFGSARAHPAEAHYQAAQETARLLAEAGVGIITGGGPGIMEAGNRGAREGGARSIGCPIQLAREERPNAYLDLALPFTFFAPRKAALLSARAFVVFPGGLGTLDELFEVLAAMQTGKLTRVPLILYDSAFWRGLLDWLRETLVEAGTMDTSDPDLLVLCDEPRAIVAKVLAALHDQQQRGEGAVEMQPGPRRRLVEVAP